MTVFAKFADLLEERDDFLLLTHERPDGDAVGSVFGLLRVLLANGKKAVAWFPAPLPGRYREFVPDGGIIISAEPPDFAGFATLLCLDFSHPDRAGKFKLEHPAIINADHHPDNHCFGTWNLVVPDCAATAELAFCSVREIEGWTIPQAAATDFLLGIIMDTGGLRFANTSPELLEASAELLRAGADHQKVILEMFFRKPVAVAALEADILLNHLHRDCNGRFLWAILSDELMATHQVDPSDTEGLIDVIRALDGAELVALLQPRPEGVRASLRAKHREFPVAGIARKFGGGGHELAAGTYLPGSLDEAVATLRREVAGLLED